MKYCTGFVSEGDVSQTRGRLPQVLRRELRYGGITPANLRLTLSASVCCIVRWVSFHPWVVSIGRLGAGRIAYWLEGC